VKIKKTQNFGYVKISTIKSRVNKTEVNYGIIEEVKIPNDLVCNMRMPCFLKDSVHIRLMFTKFADYMK